MRMIVLPLVLLQISVLLSCMKETTGVLLTEETSVNATSAFPTDATLLTLSQLRQVTDNSTTKKYYTTDEGKHGYWYLDAADKTSKDNTGTIVVTSAGKRFKRVYKDTVNVNWFGAMGNNVECTKNFQNAVNAGRIIYVPDGTYLITVANGDRNLSIWLKSNQTLLLSKNANIKAKPNNLSRYYLVKILSATNVTIDGGMFTGDKQQHSGTSGESGHLIGILNSKDVKIKNTTIRDAWGDGIYVGSDFADQSSERVTIDKVNVENSRRNGLSIVAGKNITVSNSSFSGSKGTKPESGIDIEPNSGMVATDIYLKSIKVFNNAGAGVMSTEHAERVNANSITAYENQWGIRINSSGLNTFINLNVYENVASGVYMNYAKNTVIKYSKSYKNGEHGFYVLNSTGTHKFLYCSAWENTDGFSSHGEGVEISMDSCTARNNKSYGFNMGTSKTSLQASHAYRNAKAGVLLMNYAKAISNNIYENGEQGLRVYGSYGIYQKNKIHSNSQRSNASKDNIEVAAGASQNLITANTLRTGTLTNKPRYGLNITSSSCRNNNVYPNDMKGSGVVKDLQNSGTATIATP